MNNKFHKGRELVKTVKIWPWKLELSKECVTTHLPNQLAPKMDGIKFIFRCIMQGLNKQ